MGTAIPVAFFSFIISHLKSMSNLLIPSMKLKNSTNSALFPICYFVQHLVCAGHLGNLGFTEHVFQLSAGGIFFAGIVYFFVVFESF